MLSQGVLVEGTPYRVLRELGAGGMGVVYEIEHIRLGKRYVAKILKASFQGEPGALARIDREARVLAELNHPNVVQIHDVGTTTDGMRYFVMEKLEGCDLRERMSSGVPIEPADALTIVASVLDALAHVHQRGIVHRDIKPANVFLADGPTGVVTKVLDFGIAHVSVDTNALTKTGAFLGTLEYASPEQMHGQPPGPATDVYAAGLMLFELIAGHSPFAGDPGVGVVRCFKPAPTLANVASASRALSELVARALSIYPAARPTAPELAAALHGLRAKPDALVREPTTESVSVDELLGNLGAPRPVVARSRASRPGSVPGTGPSWRAPGTERVTTGGGISAPVAQRSRRSSAWLVAVAGIVGVALVAVLVVSGVVHRREATAAATGSTVVPSAPERSAEAPRPTASGSARPAPPAAVLATIADAGAEPAAVHPATVAKPAAVARPVVRPAADPPKAPAKDGYITTLPTP